MRVVRKLDKIINYMLDGKVIQINKVETNTHQWVPVLSPLEKLTTVEPGKTLKNVITNMALLNTGSFHRNGNDIVARFRENDKNTLIITEWVFPLSAFNATVYNIIYNTHMPENAKFGATLEAIASKFYTSSYEPI